MTHTQRNRGTADIASLTHAEAQRISAMRMQLLEFHPFWGHLLLQTRLIPEPGLDALAATDCVRRIWFNPRLTVKLSMKQLGFVLAHEVGHMVFATVGRLRGRNPTVWNRATDYAINRIVARIEHPARKREPLYEPPKGILLDSRFDGWIAEAIYEHLMETDPPPTITVRVRLGGVDIGGVLDHGGNLDLHLPLDLTPDDEQELRDRVEVALTAWQQEHRRGDVPGNLDRDIPVQRRSRVPWQRILHRYIGETLIPDDYSLARPNRRYLPEGIVVPGLVHSEQHDLIVAVDTSGSMSQQDLSRAGSELAALADVEPGITVLVADASVQQVVPTCELPGFLGNCRLKGGGGTDHRPVFEWIDMNRRRPDLFIGLTDLCSVFPDKAPPYPVLWVTGLQHGAAPWGRVVVMDNER